MGKSRHFLSKFQVLPKFMQLLPDQTADLGSKSLRNCSSWVLVLLFALLLAIPIRPVSGQTWDGVAVRQADYKALQAFKHELIDMKGILRSWDDSNTTCSGKWAGIKCVNGQVIAIQLPWKALAGQISEKIGQLRALRKLSLHDNVISGAVPRSLGLLPNLRGVYLFNNRLSGSIPPSIGNLPLLQTLDLSNNMLAGAIPSGLANSTKLIRVNLSYNSLSGFIPTSFTQSFSLRILALEHNNISGTITDTWGGSGNRTCLLQFLTLDHNVISGGIPASLSKLGWLEEFSISHNRISRAIPSEMGRLKRLRRLDLSNNGINGGFPDGFFNLSSLESLNVENNSLESQIPGVVDRLQNISVLKLGKNRLSGEIPSNIGNISGIIQLDLSENNFTGEIPASLIRLLNLTSFNVSYNNLSGPVPILLLKKFNSSSFVGNLQLCGLNPSTPCPPAPSPQISPAPSIEVSKPQHHRRLSTKDKILIAAGALLVLLLLLCSVLLCCLLRKRAAAKGRTPKQATARSIEKAAPGGAEVGSGEAGGKLVHFDGPFVFTADDLLCATAEIMGKSTYGTAYKATLEDGNEVAVKRLREKTTKGQKEFEIEVMALGKIRHPNLLALRAYYLGPKGEKLLVFDYMPRGSLSSFLHARGPETTIDWGTRMKIAIGASRGMCHLHTQENLIHGNLTSSNILLDIQTNPQIADYGLSRLMTSAAATNVIATAGSQGYNAPELTKTKKPTTKTDVYSVGVIILELLTGKSPGEAMNGMDLPQWVASIVKEEWTNEVFDLELTKDTATIGDELLNTLKVALHCVDPSPAARPDVQQVLQQLEEIKPELAAAAPASGDDGAKDQATNE